MKNCTGLASVGYRDSTELVLQWWHSLGASDCTVLDGISKLFYISENELRIKMQALSCRDWFPCLFSFQIFSQCRAWFYMSMFFVCSACTYVNSSILFIMCVKWKVTF